MGEIAVRVLEEDTWQDYRDVRLAALQESPEAFLATHTEEAMQPEQYWRRCMVRPIGYSPRVMERRWALHPSK
jgi:hypothetical protein